MEVKLKQNFFGPDGRLYRKSDFGTTTVPDKFRGKLPKSSVVSDPEIVAEVPKAAEPVKAKAETDKVKL